MTTSKRGRSVIRFGTLFVQGGAGETGSETEQGSQPRSPLVLPFATRSNPRNEMSVGRRLTWIIIIAVGATFSAGMYLAGLESLSRMLGH